MNRFIQLYNVENDPVFIELQTGDASWILPPGSNVSDVLYITHITDDKIEKKYYEDLSNESVSWGLPIQELSITALQTCEFIEGES